MKSSALTFNVAFVLLVDRDNTHLSVHEDGYEDDVKDLLLHHLHEIDDIKVKDIEVEQE